MPALSKMSGSQLNKRQSRKKKLLPPITNPAGLAVPPRPPMLNNGSYYTPQNYPSNLPKPWENNNAPIEV